MIELLGSVPSNIVIAVSGGQDSMAALNFLASNSRRKVVALYFNHGTEHGYDAEGFVSDFCDFHEMPLIVGSLTRQVCRGESKEAFWREQRYSFFEEWTDRGKRNSFANAMFESGDDKSFYKAPIITCHHLDDVVETWIFTSLHGEPKLIPHLRGRFLRPFLLTKKSELSNWSERKGVPFLFDSSNDDTIYMRNFIRHEVVPKAFHVNPGLHKVIKKRLLKQFDKTVDI